PQAQVVAERVQKFGGFADLHSAATWENLFIVKTVIEAEGILGKSDTVAADRLKIQQGLSKLTETSGLIGKVKRNAREAVKPYVFVLAKSGKWDVLYTPQTN
ncbi:MAG: hypothetical protein NTZ72_04135, partial [Afipia sp.]|nr:hypothetical protein [Afipia sp.]